MSARLALGALTLSLSLAPLALAKPWAPTPPCAAPLGVDEPAVAESMCSLALAHAGDIVVREMGLPASATLAAIHVDSPVFYDALSGGVQAIVQYFIDNGMLAARTTPIAVRDLSDNNLTYVVSMMVSTAAYPDAAKIPPPQLPVQLETVGQRSVAAVQFNTMQPPVMRERQLERPRAADRRRADGGGGEGEGGDHGGDARSSLKEVWAVPAPRSKWGAPLIAAA